MIICVMDVVSVHDYLWLNCVSVSDVIVCHARLHLRGITFLVYSLSGARSDHGRAPLWSASTHLSLGRRRDPSIILQYLPWLLMHHHFHLQIPSLKHPADLNLSTWRTQNPPPHPYKCVEIWGHSRSRGQACPGRRSLIGRLGWHNWWWQRSMLVEQPPPRRTRAKTADFSRTRNNFWNLRGEAEMDL